MWSIFALIWRTSWYCVYAASGPPSNEPPEHVLHKKLGLEIYGIPGGAPHQEKHKPSCTHFLNAFVFVFFGLHKRCVWYSTKGSLCIILKIFWWGAVLHISGFRSYMLHKFRSDLWSILAITGVLRRDPHQETQYAISGKYAGTGFVLLCVCVCVCIQIYIWGVSLSLLGFSPCWK